MDDGPLSWRLVRDEATGQPFLERLVRISRERGLPLSARRLAAGQSAARPSDGDHEALEISWVRREKLYPVFRDEDRV